MEAKSLTACREGRFLRMRGSCSFRFRHTYRSITFTGDSNLEILYELTEDYYGRYGQQSIDPVVFFKLCLVGYLENITSDKKLIEHCSLRLDLLYFLGYQFDEPLPWHSTLSRTRQLLPESLFELPYYFNVAPKLPPFSIEVIVKIDIFIIC